MNDGPQTIQQQGRIFQIGTEDCGVSCKHGKGTIGKEKPKHWSAIPGKQNYCIAQYWVHYEIKAHCKTRTFPDWGCIAIRYMENKRRNHKADREKRKEAAAAQKREYRKRDYVRIAHAARMKKKKSDDPAYRVRHNLSKRLWDMVSERGNAKTSSVMKYVGCTKDQLRDHIQSMFKKGMTWTNYGKIWHIDHIIPCASFDHMDEQQIKQCWHWANLRPMIAADNIAKGDRITEPQMKLRLCSTY